MSITTSSQKRIELLRDGIRLEFERMRLGINMNAFDKVNASNYIEGLRKEIRELEREILCERMNKKLGFTKFKNK